MPRDWPHPIDSEPTSRQRQWIRIEFAIVAAVAIIALLVAATAEAGRRKRMVKRVRTPAVRMIGTASAPFPNCAAARAAGAAPVRAGSPGYSRRLDRDGDGVGCE